MGVIETEYSEIRAITMALMAGTIDKETASLVLKSYSEGGKRIDQLLKVYQMVISHGKAAKQIISKNIISDGTAIDMGFNQIEERIKCPAKGDTLIGREECLDYSGCERNIGACQKCEQFSVTRKQICP